MRSMTGAERGTSLGSVHCMSGFTISFCGVGTRRLRDGGARTSGAEAPRISWSLVDAGLEGLLHPLLLAAEGAGIRARSRITANSKAVGGSARSTRDGLASLAGPSAFAQGRLAAAAVPTWD